MTRGRTAKRVEVPPWRTVLVSFNRDAVVIDELMPGFGRALRFNFDNLRSLMIYLSARGHETGVIRLFNNLFPLPNFRLTDRAEIVQRAYSPEPNIGIRGT